MGYSYCGTDSRGRDVGYGIPATCDHPGCDARIDRGMAHACGGGHGSGEWDCDQYFCSDHLVYNTTPPPHRTFMVVCPACSARMDFAQPKAMDLRLHRGIGTLCHYHRRDDNT